MQLIKYKTLLDIIQNEKCHILLGNGFNNSLGINTSYKNIFTEMKKDYAGYKNLEEIAKQENFDIEMIINRLKMNNDKNNAFLDKYIQNKIKFDFMKATYKIVKKSIKNIYQEKNQGIYLLLKNFTNYFTFNYDPLLYLLLMSFKKGDYKEIIAIQSSLHFKEENLNITNNDIYTKIKKVRNNGQLTIKVNNNKTNKDLKFSTKQDFIVAIKTYFSNEKWTQKDIIQVISSILTEEKKNKTIENINDGFLSDEFNFENPTMQNIFFLHGAFHIYKNQKIIKKITQQQDKALYEKLESLINSENDDVICILSGTSQEKQTQIKKNTYLKKGFNKLSELEGSLVILGSSLESNDSHIFTKINDNINIKKIYISSCENTKNKDFKKVTNLFPTKGIILFDWSSISYEH